MIFLEKNNCSGKHLSWWWYNWEVPRKCLYNTLLLKQEKPYGIYYLACNKRQDRIFFFYRKLNLVRCEEKYIDEITRDSLEMEESTEYLND